MQTIASLGFGNMAQAIFTPLLKNKNYRLLCTIHKTNLNKKFQNKISPYPLSQVKEIIEQSNYILIAVKPKIVPEILNSIKNYLRPDQTIISMAAGISLKQIQDSTNSICPVALLMPNTPVKAQAGTMALCFDDPKLSPEIQKQILQIFKALGQCFILPENKFPAFTALVGCAPAYILQIAQSFIQAGIELGFTAQEARELVLANLIGTGIMAKQNPEHIQAQIEEVCSPAGMTIKGINYMHKNALPGLLTKTILTTVK